MAIGNLKLENYVSVVKNNKGLKTALPIVTTSTLTTAGLINTGTSTGSRSNVLINATVGATVVLTAAQSGSVLFNVSTSGSPSWTLPAATTSGLNFTFITQTAATGFTVTGAQVIHAKTSATGTAITTTTTLTNTQGTAVVGDFIEIISDGTAWWMRAQSGIFAAS